ncbi:MAG: FAD-binding oxidoreductase [Nitrososphaerota archaeon]
MRFDVAVIGGGSTGSSIAYHLTKDGAGKVVLLEREHVGWGQTGRSTAVVRLHYSTVEVARMALYSWEELRRMEEVVGGPSGFTACGFAIAVDERDMEGLKRNVEMQQRIGINTRIITPEELADLQPGIDVGGLAAAAYEPWSGYADPVQTAQSYAGAASEMGCVILSKTEVRGLKVESSRVVSILTNKGQVEADTVVNATGVWANSLLAGIGVRLPIHVMKEEIVVWKRPETFSGTHTVFADLPNNYYMRPYGASQTYMGSINPDTAHWGDTPNDFNLDDRVSLTTVSEYGAAVSSRFPAMAEARYAGGWIGLYDVTPDWHPIIGFSEKFHNLFHVVGLSGHGFKLAPALGKITSETILRGRSTLVDTHHFSEGRFREGRLIGSSYKYGVIS